MLWYVQARNFLFNVFSNDSIMVNEKTKDQPVVLYVDDSETNLLLFKALFEKEYNLILADSGSKALEILSKTEVAIVVSDQSMPNMSGNELLEITAKKYPETLRFILTAYTNYDSLVESINKGKIYGFFSKPIKSEEIKVALNNACEVYSLKKRNKRMVEEIKAANNELLSFDKSKTKFLNGLINEIRSPINRIMTTVNMIKDKIESPDLTELLSLLDTNVSRLESFSFATNELFRLKNDNVVIRSEKTSLLELLEISIIEKRNHFAELGISVTNKNVDDIQVMGDFELLLNCLGIILMTLLMNLKKSAELNFALTKNDNHTFLDILASETNYSSSKLIRLKQLFDENDNRVDDNLSVELMLSRQIMILHRGKIDVIVRENNSVLTRLIFPNV